MVWQCPPDRFPDHNRRVSDPSLGTAHCPVTTGASWLFWFDRILGLSRAPAVPRVARPGLEGVVQLSLGLLPHSQPQAWWPLVHTWREVPTGCPIVAPRLACQAEEVQHGGGQSAGILVSSISFYPCHLGWGQTQAYGPVGALSRLASPDGP